MNNTALDFFKNSLLTILFFVLLMFGYLAISRLTPRTVTTIGTARQTFERGVTRVSILYTDSGTSQTALLAQANADYESLRGELLNLGVSRVVKTSQQIAATPAALSGSLPTNTFSIQQGIEVEMANPDQLSFVIEALNSPAYSILGYTYEPTSPEASDEMLFDEAMLKAERKAANIARKNGFRLDGVFNISELDANQASGNVADTSELEDQVRLSKSVSVTFKLRRSFFGL